MVFCLVLPAQAAAGIEVLDEGRILPEIKLENHMEDYQAEYLGIKGKNDFKVTDVKGNALIIEFFSMYCPHCQREAPIVNKLYEASLNYPEIKMIGIGVGNSLFEINHFKKTYNIFFPLFPDGDFHIHKDAGEPRTPYFVVIDLRPGRSGMIIFSQLGGIHEIDDFFKLIEQKIKW